MCEWYRTYGHPDCLWHCPERTWTAHQIDRHSANCIFRAKRQSKSRWNTRAICIYLWGKIFLFHCKCNLTNIFFLSGRSFLCHQTGDTKHAWLDRIQSKYNTNKNSTSCRLSRHHLQLWYNNNESIYFLFRLLITYVPNIDEPRQINTSSTCTVLIEVIYTLLINTNFEYYCKYVKTYM